MSDKKKEIQKLIDRLHDNFKKPGKNNRPRKLMQSIFEPKGK